MLRATVFASTLGVIHAGEATGAEDIAKPSPEKTTNTEKGGQLSDQTNQLATELEQLCEERSGDADESDAILVGPEGDQCLLRNAIKAFKEEYGQFPNKKQMNAIYKGAIASLNTYAESSKKDHYTKCLKRAQEYLQAEIDGKPVLSTVQDIMLKNLKNKCGDSISAKNLLIYHNRPEFYADHYDSKGASYLQKSINDAFAGGFPEWGEYVQEEISELGGKGASSLGKIAQREFHTFQYEELPEEWRKAFVSVMQTVKEGVDTKIADVLKDKSFEDKASFRYRTCLTRANVYLDDNINRIENLSRDEKDKVFAGHADRLLHKHLVTVSSYRRKSTALYDAVVDEDTKFCKETEKDEDLTVADKVFLNLYCDLRKTCLDATRSLYEKTIARVYDSDPDFESGCTAVRPQLKKHIEQHLNTLPPASDAYPTPKRSMLEGAYEQLLAELEIQEKAGEFTKKYDKYGICLDKASEMVDLKIQELPPKKEEL